MPKSDSARQCRAIFIYIIAAFLYIIVFFHRLVAASIADELKEKFQGSTGGNGNILETFSSLYFYFYAFLQPFVGITVDAIKPRWTIFMAGIFMTIGSLVIAFPRNLYVAYFGRSLVGIGAAFVYVPILKLIALWFPMNRFSLLTGIMVALGGLGGFICTAPLTLLVQTIVGNNSGVKSSIIDYIFGIAGGVTALLTLVFVFVAHDTPEKAGYAPIANPSANSNSQSESPATNPASKADNAPTLFPTVSEGTLVSSGVVNPPDSNHDFYCNTSVPSFEILDPTKKAATATSPLAKKSSTAEFCDSMKTVFCSENSKYLIIMMVAYFFCTGSYFTISASSGVKLITETIDPSNTNQVKIQATWVQAGLNLGTIVGSPLQSVFANLAGRKPMQLINNGIMTLVYIGVALAVIFTKIIWVYGILYALIGLIGGTMIVVAYTNVKEMFPVSVSGTAIGFFNIAPFLGAAVFQNVSPELIKLNSGKKYDYMCYLLAANTGVAMIILLFSKETRPVQSRKEKRQKQKKA